LIIIKALTHSFEDQLFLPHATALSSESSMA
jgi:hypothetical protein